MEKWRRPSTTADRLKEAMKHRGVKQVDLSKITGIHKGSLSNYTSGRYEPKSEVINKLAKALNCSEMWLWGYDVPMERQDTQQSSPDKVELTEGEKVLIGLFRRVPEDQQQLVLQMIRAALGTQEQ